MKEGVLWAPSFFIKINYIIIKTIEKEFIFSYYRVHRVLNRGKYESISGGFYDRGNT